MTAVASVTEVDVSGMDADEHLDRMRHELSSAADRLSPWNGRMFEAVWFRGGDTPTLGLVIHHLAVDSVSWQILMSDLVLAWDAVARGDQPVLEQPATPFRAWARRLAERSHSPAVSNQLAIWEATLTTPGALVPDAALCASDTVATARELTVEVPPDITRAILDIAVPAFHAQVDEILLTAVGVAAEAWRRRRGGAGEQGILVDVERHGREPFEAGTDIDRVVGWFTSLSPVALGMPGLDLDDALAAGPAMGRALKHTRQALQAIPDHGIGYGLLRYSNPETTERLAALPTPQIAFNYGGRVEQSRGGLWSPHWAAGALQPAPAPAMPLAHWITINAVVLEGPEGPQISARWIWASARLDESSVRALADEWLRAVHAIGHHAGQPGAGGRTPGDFPLVHLTQQQVEVLESACGDVEDILPLAPLQEGLLFHSLYDSAAADVYVVQIAREIAGLIDPPALRAAAEALLRRHGNLRVSIHHRGLIRPVQVVPHQIQLPWREIDLRRESDPRARCDQILRADREERFDPEAGPLMRFTLCRVADDRHVFAVAYHHVLFDGWSTPLLVAELLTLYHQDGAPDRLPPVRPYTDFLRWLSEQDHEGALNTWRACLEGIDGATLVSERGRAGAVRMPPSRTEADVSEACTSTLLALARQHGVTLNTVLQAAWAVLLGRLTGRRDVTFGSTVSGRPPEITGVERMIGLFVNTVPVRVRLSHAQTFWNLAADLQAARKDLEDVQYVGLGEIQRLTGIDDLFDTLLVFENYPLDRRALTDASRGLTIAAAEGHDAAHYPLTLVVAPGERLHLRVDYDASRLSDERVRKCTAELLQLLESVIETPDRPLYRLQTLDAHERSTVLHAFQPHRTTCIEGDAAGTVRGASRSNAVRDGSRLWKRIDHLCRVECPSQSTGALAHGPPCGYRVHRWYRDPPVDRHGDRCARNDEGGRGVPGARS